MPIGSAHLDLRQMLGSLKSAGIPGADAFHPQGPNHPFITISREPGIDAGGLGALLVKRLNSDIADPAGHWRYLDHELIESLARELDLPASMIESLERTSRTWIAEFLAGLHRSDPTRPNEPKVFRKVMEFMRALANAGHVILTGLGGAMMTRDLPGGIHLQLVAPADWRAKNLARARQIRELEAVDQIALLDQDRAAFYRRFWPAQPLSPALYHFTLNAGLLSESQMADIVLQLVPGLRQPARR